MSTATIADPGTVQEEPARTTDEQAAAEAQGFHEGFEDREETPPTTAPATEPDPHSSPATSGDGTKPGEGQTATPTPAPTEPEYVQLTKADWQKTQEVISELQGQVKRVADETGGKIGGLNQLVAQLKAATPRGQKVSITAEDFKELQEEFPLLVDSQLKGLNRVLEKLVGTGAPETSAPPAQPAQPAAPVIDVNALKRSVREDLAREALTEEHPDWTDVVGLPQQDGGQPPETAFRQWLKTKPEADQQKVLGSWNPQLIARTITEFKEHQAAKTAPGATDGQTRRARLQSGVAPRSAGGGSGGPSTPTEEQALLDGFNS